jgi:triacylglycerol esterase/lipase EstA (alpha/beta hydrolase family)
VSGKILAYPGGLPGGWCKHRKVHFICHSLGAVTVRYLQHLLEIDYFDYGVHCEHEDNNFNSERFGDRNEWVASVTCVNPVLNGSVGTYFFGID